jgi:integrative and conjugative element protein (TIGR02256 family)
MRSLRKQIGTAWISKRALAFMAREFRRAFPEETGGVLVGYSTTGPEGVVITHAVGPGPCAMHGKRRFVPDWSYHESEVARLYEESGRLHTYLGDWHSHPNSCTRLSPTDRGTLSKIAKHTEARVTTPLMAIIGAGDPLTLQIWQYRPGRAFGIISDKIVSLQIRQFS